MDTLPEEVFDTILEKILLDNPFRLYSLRAVSKTWKRRIDVLVMRREIWRKACRSIPENCRNDILRKQFPLSIWPWQLDYWNTPNHRACRSLYMTWKQLDRLTDQRYSCKITRATSDIRNYNNGVYFFSLTVGNHIVAELTSRFRSGTYISKLNDFHKSDIAFPTNFRYMASYHVNGRDYVILHGDTTGDGFDTYITDTNADNEPSVIRLKCRRPQSRILIIENEFFYVNEYKIQHYVYQSDADNHNIDDSSRRLSSEFILPTPEPDKSYYVGSFQVNGNHLHVVCEYREESSLHGKVLSFTYEITRLPDGKLEFFYRDTQYWDTVDIGTDRNRISITKSTKIVNLDWDPYLRTESSSIFKSPEGVYDTFQFTAKFNSWLSESYNVYCTEVFSFANHFIALGYLEDVMIFRANNRADLIQIEDGLPPASTVMIFRANNRADLIQIGDGLPPAAMRKIHLPGVNLDAVYNMRYVDIVFQDFMPIILVRNDLQFFYLKFERAN